MQWSRLKHASKPSLPDDQLFGDVVPSTGSSCLNRLLFRALQPAHYFDNFHARFRKRRDSSVTRNQAIATETFVQVRALSKE